MTCILLFLGTIGPWEMMVILVIVLILFGGGKIPQLAKDLGEGIKEFRKSMSGPENDSEKIKLGNHETDYDKEPKKSRKS